MKPACAAIITAFVLLDGCTANQVGVLPMQKPTDVSAVAKLQLAVGTATMALSGGGSVVGMNVVATFRTPDGQNATLVNTPTLSGPALFDSTHSITGDTPLLISEYAAAGQQILPPPPGPGLPPNVPAHGLPAAGQFGSLIGVFGYGLAPLNLQSTPQYNIVFPPGSGVCDGPIAPDSTVVGATATVGSPRFVALDLPIYGDTNAGKSGELKGCLAGFGSLGYNSPTTYRYYGGPPAWPSPQGYGIPNGFLGYPAGFTTFATAPVTGAYALDVAYPVTPDGKTYGHSSTSANLKSAAALPLFPRPNVRPQNDGSVQIDVNVPGGLSEAIVFISTTACTFGPNGTIPSNYYSILLTGHAGAQTVVLSNNLGPPDASGKPTDTLCTVADDRKPNVNPSHTYSATAVGFDYPAFEASYPQNSMLAPTIANAQGQADLTVSDPIVGVSYQLQ